MRLLRRAVAILLALLVAALLAVAATAWRATPAHDGTLRVAGLRGELRIERDAHDIPTIRAASVEDAAFGVGFVHAQDRLWQLQTHLRIGAGRLAEAFGPAALDSDRFLRTLGVMRTARAQFERLPPESRRVLEAYAAGINAWQRQHLAVRPPEMLILGLPTEDWQPEVSLAWALMMAWDLGGNWTSELLRARLALTLARERVDELLPPYPGDRPLVTADYGALYRGLQLGGALALLSPERSDALLAAAPPSGIEGTGSNNWVLAGTRTTSGQPLLANDPHLKITTPALWYFARIEVAGAGGFKVAGATMPGLPLVVLGQNERVAWGFTNTGPDVQDLYLEQFAPGDTSRVRQPDGSFAPLQTWTETIRVRGGAQVHHVARASRHGPLVSDAGGAAATLARDRHALALRWTALEAIDADPVAVALAFQRATSAAAFVDAATRGWVAPMQTMVVADRDGHIAIVAPGRVPVRRPDNDLKGLVPAPGWDARYDWAGQVPAHETPRESDPPRGWLASANQRIHGADYPHFLTSDWAAPYRQQRIEQLLAERERHSIDDMAAMQADQLSLATLKLLPALRAARSDHALAAVAQAALRGFDGRMRADSAAPLIVWAWSRQMVHGVFADELGGAESFERVLGARSFRDALEGVLDRNDAWWCDDKRTPALAESCSQQAGAALTRALDELQQRFGADLARWRWGDAHQARSEHRPFSRVPMLARWFELREPTGGDTYTLNAGRVGVKPDAVTGELYLNEHAPSMRAIYDLGDPARSRFMHSTGQSGLPWSRHYRDFSRPWVDGRYLPLWGQPGSAVSTLVIQPAASATP
jgi:penicillin amidase